MARRGEVLVAIMNKPIDWTVVREERWYRIPVESQAKWLKDRWPPEGLAFYQTKAFGGEAFAIRYYADVLDIRRRYRWQLLPNEPRDNNKSQREYYQLMLGDLHRLPQPIFSRRWRRIVFIPTTWRKLMAAQELNDLFDDSPLEDRLWAEFRRLRIVAERQEWVRVHDRDYALDFAVYCALGKLAVETDGDTWHSDPERIPLDNLRDNDLETAGWSLLRFNTKQIHAEMESYCAPTVIDKVNKLGGLDEGRDVPRLISPDSDEGMYQPGLFD